MPFVKGDPNINRNGRPKGISITEMVKKALEEVDDKTGKYWKDLVINKILSKAVKDGDIQMLKAIWAYIDGMPKESVKVDGEIKQLVEPLVRSDIPARHDVRPQKEATPSN